MASEKRRSDDNNWFKNHYVLWTFSVSLAGLIAYIFTTFPQFTWAKEEHARLQKELQGRYEQVDEKLNTIIDKSKENQEAIKKNQELIIQEIRESRRRRERH